MNEENVTTRQDIFKLLKLETNWDDERCNQFIDEQEKEYAAKLVQPMLYTEIKNEHEFVESLNFSQKKFFATLQTEMTNLELKLQKKYKKALEKDSQYKLQLDNVIDDLNEIKDKIKEIVNNKGKIQE